MDLSKSEFQDATPFPRKRSRDGASPLRDAAIGFGNMATWLRHAAIRLRDAAIRLRDAAIRLRDAAIRLRKAPSRLGKPRPVSGNRVVAQFALERNRGGVRLESSL